MSINRPIWRTLFDKDSFPRLPCARCQTGRVGLVAGSISEEEPAHSKAEHSHEDWEPHWVEERFSARMICDEAACGEIAHMLGDTVVDDVYIDDDADGYIGMGLQTFFRPRSVFPAPKLFWITKSVPKPIKTQLELGFQLFWMDLSVSLGRYRTAIELVLDDKGIAKTAIDAKNKQYRLNLSQRIDKFSKTTTDDNLKIQLQALRNIGNLGTHGSPVEPDDYFDAVDVLEDVLLGIYESNSLKSKVAKLSSLK